MKYIELKNSLEKEISPCYLLKGDDDFLLEHSLNLMEKKLFGKNLRNNINKQVFNTAELEIDKLFYALNSAPFFAEKKLIILKEYDGKKNSEIVSQLSNYLLSPCPSTIFVIKAISGSDYFNGLKNNFAIVDCNRLDKSIIKKWIENKLKNNEIKKDIKIEEKAMELLIDYTNGYLSKITMELDKLISYCDKEITTKDIEQLVPKDLEYSVFELTDSLANFNNKKAEQIKQDLLNNKKTANQVLGLIQSFFRRLFYSIITDGSDEEIASQLLVKPYAITKSKQLAKKFGAKKLKQILEICIDLDYKTKTSQMSIENATNFLVSSIINLQSK